MNPMLNESPGIRLIAFCEEYQPFRFPGWSKSDLSRAMGWTRSRLDEVLNEELDTDFETLCAVFRLSFVDRLVRERRADWQSILQMAGFDSVDDYEISRKMLVFSKGFI